MCARINTLYLCVFCNIFDVVTASSANHIRYSMFIFVLFICNKFCSMFDEKMFDIFAGDLNMHIHDRSRTSSIHLVLFIPLFVTSSVWYLMKRCLEFLHENLVMYDHDRWWTSSIQLASDTCDYSQAKEEFTYI